MNTKQLERILTDQLEDKTLEELFEEFDLTALEVFKVIYDSGLMDEEILDRMVPSDA